MKLFRLGLTTPLASQVCYHALARLGVEGLVLVSPRDPYVCIGYFQEASSAVDLDFCRRAGLPIYRREVGGGAVLLDAGQVFYQLILRRDNPMLPRDIEGLYEKFSVGAISAHRRLGLEVCRRPVNDLVTAGGRKISGQGGADIGPSRVFVGSVIVDFDYETMCRALRVPDEKFRDKLYRSMREGLTTVSRELGRTPARSAVEEALIAGFSEVVGPLEEAVLPPEVADEMERVGEVLSSPEFLHWRHPSLRPGVRVNSRTTVAEGHHKAPGGLVTALVEWERGPEGGWGSRTEDGAAARIAEAEIFGDFTLSPPEAVARLGAAVRGLPPVWDRLEEALEKCYRQAGIDAPGVRPQDVADAIIASFREVK